MQIGIFGGTFDPVHYGHLLLAESSREQCRLDEVWFMPNFQSPHKIARPLTPVHQRIEMLDLATAGHTAMTVSRVEANRGEISYTVDTLEQLKRERPGDEFFFLMGADSLQDLPNWRRPVDICELAVPVVVQRAGSPAPDFDALEHLITPDRRTLIERHVVQMPRIDLSSSDLRQRVAEGRSIRFRTPRAVEEYIAAHGLYRA